MTLAIRIEIMLIAALLVVASDQGNFLLRKSLSIPFPPAKTNEYMKEIKTVNKKFSIVFSFVKTKKKNIEVANDIQSKVIKFLRFMIQFLSSNLDYIQNT